MLILLVLGVLLGAFVVFLFLRAMLGGGTDTGLFTDTYVPPVPRPRDDEDYVPASESWTSSSSSSSSESSYTPSTDSTPSYSSSDSSSSYSSDSSSSSSDSGSSFGGGDFGGGGSTDSY